MSLGDGRRIVNLVELANNLYCKQCRALLDLNHTEKEIRVGLASVLYVTCVCGATNDVHTDCKQEHCSQGRVMYLINLVASASLQECGVMGYVIENFFAALKILLPAVPFDDVSLESPSPLLQTQPPITDTDLGTVTRSHSQVDGVMPLAASSPVQVRQDAENPAELWPDLAKDADELDMFVMGFLTSSMRQGETTVSSKKKEKAQERIRIEYILMDKVVCKKTFFFLTGVKEKRLRNIIAHFKKEGPCQRQSKRGGRKNNIKALSHADIDRVRRFILNYAEENAVSLPGRVSGFRRDDILLLPSSTPKSKVHRDFLDSPAAAEETNSFQTFTNHSAVIPNNHNNHHLQGNDDDDNSLEENSHDNTDDDDDNRSNDEGDMNSDDEGDMNSNDEGDNNSNDEGDYNSNDEGDNNSNDEDDNNCNDEGDNNSNGKGDNKNNEDGNILDEEVDDINSDEEEEDEDNEDNDFAVPVKFEESENLAPLADILKPSRDDDTKPAVPLSVKTQKSTTVGQRTVVQRTAMIVSTLSSDKPYGCGVCFRAYNSEELCHAHIQSHIGNKPFLCEDCGRGFVCQYNLKLHKRQHTGERPFRCEDCGRGFIRWFTLKRHQQKHQGVKSFSCQQCGEAFCSHESLKRHRRVHTGEKPFSCDQCDKTFRGESNLYAHRRRHFGIKPYKCPECDAAFVESTHLTRHRRTHTKEQPYVCETCGARYTQSSTLAVHRKKHTGEAKKVTVLQCANCGKMFNSYTQLKRHKRTHTGEKPYVCDICHTAFTQSSSLKAHRRIHTGERPYKCDHCGESFLYPRTLKRHVKKHLDGGQVDLTAEALSDRPSLG